MARCYGCAKEESDDGADPPPPKLLQEFCEGGTLLARIQKGPKSYSALQSVQWLDDTAKGMAYLHQMHGNHEHHPHHRSCALELGRAVARSCMHLP